MATLAGFTKAIEAVRRVESEMRIHHLHFLLIVHREHDKGVTYEELENALSVTKGTVSRIGRYLGTYMKQDRKGKYTDIGQGFVDVRPDPYNPRSRVVTLTKKGSEFCNILERQLNR